MNAYAWSSFITFISVFFIGTGVLLHDLEGKINRQFALFSASISIWAAGRVLYLTESDPSTALFWARVTIAGTVFIPTFFLHFVFAFLKLNLSRILAFSYAASFFLLLADLTPWMVKGVAIKYQSSFFIERGPLYPLLIVFFTFDLLVAFYLLLQRYRKVSGLEQKQIRFVFWSTLIGFSGGVTNFLPDFNLEIDSLSAFATYFVPLYVVTLTYAIARYHLLDVEIVIQKGLVSLFTLLITAIPFFLLTTLFQAVFTLRQANIASFFLFIVVLFIFSNIKPLTQQWVERSLFRERYRHYKSIHEFSQSIIRFLHLEDLTENLFRVLTKTLHPQFISIFLLDQKGFFHLHRTFGHEEGTLDALFSSNHPLLERLKKEKKIVSREEMERLRETTIVRQMETLHSDLCLPLVFENRLIGLCTLGPKEGGKGYSQSEIFMLQTLSANASIAFENARLYREVTTYIEQFAAISRAINLSPDVDQIFELLLKEIQKYTPFDWGSLAIYKQEGEISFYRVKGRHGTPLPKDYTWPLTDLNVISRLSIQKEPLCQTDLYDPNVPEKEKKLVKKGVRSYVILPLWARGKLIGTLNLWSPYPLERPAQALDLIVPLTNHLAPFLEVARLFEEMKKTNEALRQKSLELEASQREQARFFSFVTHELRTPLNAIIGYLSLILDGSYGSVDAKQAVAIHRAKENSALLKQLINDFLDLARLETDKIPIRLEEIELGNFLEELLGNMESLLMQRKIDVRLNIEHPIFLYTDRPKLRQILQNILSNAIKFTEQGSIRLTVRLIPESESVLIEISDSGKGIAREDLPHIFEPFWQAQSESSGAVKGSGLGLTIVKKTVDLLKGQINVSSLVGFGTTFTLLLPQRYPQDRRKTA